MIGGCGMLKSILLSGNTFGAIRLEEAWLLRRRNILIARLGLALYWLCSLSAYSSSVSQLESQRRRRCAQRNDDYRISTGSLLHIQSRRRPHPLHVPVVA